MPKTILNIGEWYFKVSPKKAKLIQRWLRAARTPLDGGKPAIGYIKPKRRNRK